ncbi:MAG: hypothetical protein Rhirs2KO_09840 [Rhizobiaceae bacterium]
MSKLIEAGWVSYRMAAVPLDAPADQLEEMRDTFFAGALHLHKSICSFLEHGDEPTDADLARMREVNAELDAFLEEFIFRDIELAPGRGGDG